ncbi:MAG: outer membrane lipoprotein carrier protein LolA [Endomicrobium sp.]|uniref:LolA family protein n=1 Tax=Candidatus Endomicrobiellum pyrsonymphae TaxID=1408203 RepID=UPI00358A9CF6|nr:outer membrane lipoprotein carrier protein LolA [Endomicrobium sp.]
MKRIKLSVMLSAAKKLYRYFHFYKRSSRRKSDWVWSLSYLSVVKYPFLDSLAYVVMYAVVLINIIVSLGFAQTLNDKLNVLLLDMESADKKIHTLKAEYTQTILFESTKEKQEIVGTLFLKKPDSIYISQKTPQEQRIYIDGRNIIIYTPDNGQALIDNWKNVIDGDFAPAAIASFGSSWREMKKTNTISFDGENEKYIVVKIVPVRDKDWTLEIYVSRTTMYPCKAVLKSDDVKVEIIFKSYTVNPMLDKTIFKFSATNDVEIIKLN